MLLGSVIMLNFAMLSAIMLSAIMLNVIKLNVIMPRVVAPKNAFVMFASGGFEKNSNLFLKPATLLI
jgi:hypothetical protein